MRLIDTSTLELKEFFGCDIPPYAILSHRWGPAEEEVTFKEYKKGLKTDTPGFIKIRQFCQLAESNNCKWAWVDTCCIDKRSSAELSEAINSMFAWYRDASACYAYLSDVDERNQWRDSKWWTRGWTLQELIAPTDVHFFGKDWRYLGNKHSLASEIQALTGIPEEVLCSQETRNYKHWSVAQKMSWASARQTTRIEDRAYCLLGLFHINMPLLYGEGAKAFERLQLQILQKYSDESILAWSSRAEQCGLSLAASPDAFSGCGNMAPTGLHNFQLLNNAIPTAPRVTSYGIEFFSDAQEIRSRYSLVSYRAASKKRIWEVPLKTMWSRCLQELPCRLVLMANDSSAFTFRRMGCFRLDSAERVAEYQHQWIRVGNIIPNMRFYLDFDPDFNR